MTAHYAQLGTLKATLAGLGSPAIREYRASSSILAFFRGEPGPGEVLAVFNNATAAGSLELPAGSWTDAVSGGAVTGTATVDGRGWRYLVKD